jgi:hypothetical protein
MGHGRPCDPTCPGGGRQFKCTKSVTGVVALRSKWAAGPAVAGRDEGAYLDVIRD